MADFDLDQFLNERSEALAGATPAGDAFDYLPSGTIEMAGSQKAYSLDAMSAEKQRALEESWKAKTGALGGFAADLAVSATRFGTHLTNLIPNLAATTGLWGVSEDAVQAYNRELAGTPEEGDDAILNQIAAGSDGVEQTMRDRIIGVRGLQEVAKNVAKAADISSIQDRTDRIVLSDDIRENTKQGVALLREAGEQFNRGEFLDALLSGAAGTVQTVAGAAPAVVDNPAAIASYTVENTAQLAAYALAPELGIAGNAGYGAEQYREGMTDYATKNKGALPDQADRYKMGLAAASAALAETIGDRGILAGLGGRSIVGSVAGAAAKEGVTEGYQTWAENVAHLKDTSIVDIVEGATIGAAVGGALTGGGRVVSGAKEGAHAAERLASDVEAKAKAEATGDIAPLTDITAPTYNPAGAVDVLRKQAIAEDATPTVKERAQRQADRIEQTLANRVSELEQVEFFSRPETQAKLDESIAAREAELTQAGADTAAINEQLAALRGAKEQGQNFSEEQAAALKDYSKRLAATREAIVRMQTDASPDAAEVAAAVQEVQDSVPESADRIITLTMTNPDVISTADLRSMASNENNSLTADQRASMEALANSQEAYAELQSMKNVSTDIMQGSAGFKGIPQYRNAVRMALMDGNIDAAQTQVAQLAAFADSRTSKFNAIDSAYSEVRGTDNSIRIAPNADGVWERVSDSMSPRQLKSAGGLEISARSHKLRDAVALEARALTEAALSLQATVNNGPLQVDPVASTEAALNSTEEVVPATPGQAGEAQAPAAVVDQANSAAPDVAEEGAATDLSTVGATTAPDSEVAADESVAAETGELTVFKNSQIAGQPVASQDYQKTNLAAAFFTQEAKKAETDTDRPLVAVPDFISTMRAKGQTEGYAEMAKMAGVDALTDVQKGAIKRFFTFTRAAKPVIESSLRPFVKTGVNKRGEDFDTRDYHFKDQAQFLINEDGSLDENLSTAIAYAVFSWGNDAAGNLINSDAGINAILGRDSNEEISPAAYAALAYVGTRQAVVVSQLGAKVLEILGVQTLPNAPVNERARLEASLGSHALAVLKRMGLATINTISDAELKKLMASNEKANPALYHSFVSPVSERVEGKLQVGPVAQRIREATVGSQSILDKLFGSQQGAVEPSLTPLDFTQKKAKRTQDEVPSELATILNAETKKAHYLRQDMWQVWGLMGPDALAQIAGVVDTTDVPTHKANRAGQEAKNDGLRQQIANFSQFFERIGDISELGVDAPLYFDRSVWKPQRVGLTANVINPQTSKVHRHMLRMEGWNSEIKFADQALMDGFKLRIMEAFGKKTEASDTSVVLQGYDAMVGTDAIQGAVDALAKMLRGESANSSAEVEAVVRGVAEAGEKFHSLDALVALAHEKIARENGAESFNTEMMGEVDGVTNGPMLSLLMLGAKDFGTLNQGGFFQIGDLDQKGNQITQFNTYKGAGNLDLYESTIAGVLRLLGNDPRLAAVEAITGKLFTDEGDVTSKGRKVIKQPLTAMMFGSNTKTAVDGMADGFIDTIYERMEDAARSNNLDALKKTIDAANLLIGNKREYMDSSVGFEAALNTEFTEKQKNAIKASFYDLLGSKVEENLNDTYAVFMARRDTINKSANLAYELYQAAFEAKRQVLLETADLPRGKTGLPFSDLTKAQNNAIVAELKGMQPLLHTPMSKASNNLEAGMSMQKTKRELNDTSLYASEVHFGQPVNYILPNGDTKNAMSLNVSGLTTTTEGPGVAPLITSIHSTDSSISHGAIQGHDILNIHDAHGAGVNGVPAAGQRLNESTFQNMLNYSTASEMVSTLERTVNGFANLLADPDMAARLQGPVKAILEKMDLRVADQLESIRHVAREADTDKLTMLSQMAAVGQYATEGGSHIVTEEQRAAAREALSKVGQNFDEVAVSQAEAIDALANAAPIVRKPAPKQPLSADSVTTLAPATSLNALDRAEKTASPELKQSIAEVRADMIKRGSMLAESLGLVNENAKAEIIDSLLLGAGVKSVWGELGTPVVQSDAALVELLEGSEGITARGLAIALEARSQNPFNKKLLAALVRLTSDDLPVILVTSQTGPDGAMGEGVSKARGWYAAKGNFDALYVKNTEFVESGITEEFLTHELVHTVTGRIIQRELDRKARDASYNSTALSYVENLQEILKVAKDLIDNNGTLSGKYANAVTDVHELVSWGMTNAGFQQEVLAKVFVEATPRNKFTQGLQRFIAALTGLIFGKVSVVEGNGLAEVIANTSGLFAEAQAQMNSRGDMTVRYEDAVNSTNEMTTKQIFAQLGQRGLSGEHVAKLTGLLDGIVANLHGPMGAFARQVQAGQALTNADVVIKALSTDKLPFASKALASAFVTTQAEQYVLEQVEATVAHALDSNEGSFIRDSLQRLWSEAKATVKVEAFHDGDWSVATAEEKALAAEKWNFLFRIEQAGARNSYLSRFAALGMASEEVSGVLNFNTASRRQSLKGMPLATRLVTLFQRLLEKLGQLHDKTQPGELANHRLFTLVDRLVDIEAKRRARLAEQKVGVIDQIETATAAMGERVRAAADNLGQSTFFKGSNSAFVRLAGNTISTVATNRVDLVLEGIQRLRDEKFHGKQGLAMGIVNEMRGTNDANRMATELFKAAKKNEMERKAAIEDTVTLVNGGFKNGGQYLTPKDRAALTKTLLRTNMGMLADVLGFDAVRNLLENPADRQTLITQLEDQLWAMPDGAYYLGAVKDLAYHKSIGGNVSPNLMQNTMNIADRIGTHLLPPINSKAAKDILDQLLPLYAYEYTGSAQKAAMLQVLRTESNRQDGGNGIDMILKLHAGLQKNSKSFLFEGTERLMADGYVPEITDPKIEMVMVHAGDLAYMQSRGFVLVGNVQTDSKAGLGSNSVIMTRRGAGQANIVTGSMSYTGMHAKGTSVGREAVNMLSDFAMTDEKTVSTVKARIAQDVRDMFSRPRDYDPRKQKAQRVAPKVDPNGKIVDFRYMMTEANRDSLLDRDSSMDQVLGVLAGSIVDKVSSHQQNVDVIRSLYDQYVEDYNNRPSSYVQVGKDSTDESLREMWSLLPFKTREEIRKIWKSDNMWIPANQLDLIMGYRKISLTTPFGLPEEERNLAEKALVAVTGAVFGGKAELRVGQAQDVVQELVKMTKDILVVKNIFTLVGNIVSNISVLAVNGVSPTAAIRSHAIGIKAALDYRKDSTRLDNVNRMIEVGYTLGNEDALREEAAILRDRLARNPIKPLVDAGLMPTIVEDVEADDSRYSYSSLLQRKTEKFTNKVPKFVRDVGRQVFMTHDTAAYKFLSQATQLSDLVARFTLVEHVTTRAKDPLSVADAMQLADDSFINYDLLSHRTLQFLNDMGLVMFTKYYLRVQKVIMNLVREKPARVLALVVANHFISGLDSILDSSWINKLGNNPFQAGPFAFPSSLAELPGIKGIMNL